MKKTYSKPTLEVIAFEVNEAIATCDIKLHNNYNPERDCELTEEFDLLFGQFADYGSLFGVAENCDVVLEDYCYFTSTGDAKFLMNS